MKRLRSSQVKVRAVKSERSVIKISEQHSHSLDVESRVSLRLRLLSWYDVNKRDLPWRDLARHEDANIRAYSVLVSEIMLQQTQVATVKPYYARWMEKWPDVLALSKATLEEVNTLWSGLGYYSRARRLYEAACKITNELNGFVPQTAKELQKLLPGVGPYTAAAVSSIAFNEAVGLVDGNVTRVMTRLCCIGADVNRKNVTDEIWCLVNELVDPERPGDFNQALMELGATSKLVGSDNGDYLLQCPRYRRRDGVTNYPRKGKMTAAKPARNIVLVVERTGSGPEVMEYLLWQRPSTGLLANLWEFPSFPTATVEHGSSELQSALDHCGRTLMPRTPLQSGRAIERCRYVADVFHQFSHISQTYAVYRATVAVAPPCEPQKDETEADSRQPSPSCHLPTRYQAYRWMTADQISAAAVSTAMKKVFERALARNNDSTGSGCGTAAKRKGSAPDETETRREEAKRRRRHQSSVKKRAPAE